MKNISINFNLNQSRKTKNGRAFIQVRIAHMGVRKSLPSGLSIEPRNWDKGRAKGRTIEARKINKELRRIEEKVLEISEALEREYGTVSVAKIRAVFTGEEKALATLLDHFDDYLERTKTQAEMGQKAPGTVGLYANAKKHVANYLKTKYGKKDIDLKLLDFKFVSGFETFMLQEIAKPLTQVTATRNMKFLKTVLNDAKKLDLIDKDPFARFKLKHAQKDAVFLTSGELEKLKALTLEDKELEIARDTFVFCAYTGLAYVDVASLSESELIQEGSTIWVEKMRHKTGVDSKVRLLKPALQVLERYKGVDGQILPVPPNIKYNKLLKELASLAGIGKKLTSHTARHTFATMMLTHGVSLEATSKMLGHSDTKMTQHYAKVLKEKISNELDLAEKNLMEKGVLA